MIFWKKRKEPPIKSAEFKKIVSKHIAPRLRELGWKGSGFHFKRIHDDYPFIDLIGFQVNNYGGTFCVEIGVHPIFLKESWEGEYDLKKLTHASLDIRKRLTPNNEYDYWWDIGFDEASSLKTLEIFWNVFLDKTIHYFDYLLKLAL